MSETFSVWFRKLLARSTSSSDESEQGTDFANEDGARLSLSRRGGTVSAESRGQPRLVVRRSVVPSQQVGAREFIRSPQTSLGRTTSNDIVVFDSKVSREHCEFVRDGDDLVVRDLGSANGVAVNGEWIERPTPLRSGDRVSIADDLVVFEVLAGTRAAEDDDDFALSARDPVAALPVPILVPLMEVMIAETQLARVKAAAQALEVHLKFVVACALAALDPRSDVRGVRALLGKPVSTGAWLEVFLEVTELASDVGSGLAMWFRSLTTSDVRRRLNQAVAARNRSIGHGASVREGAYDQEEERLLDALAQLARVASESVLSEYRAVAICGARVSLDSDAFDYVVLQACGVNIDPVPHSLRTTHRLAAR